MNKLAITAGIIAFALCGSQAHAGQPMRATDCHKKCPADVGLKKKAGQVPSSAKLYFAYKVKITNGSP